jgi:hypothetical protein
MKRGFLLILACLALVLTVAAAAAPAKQAAHPAKQADACTWGASSVVVEEVNGQLVQSEPSTSGCIPH